MTTYTESFFDYTDQMAMRSAGRVLPVIAQYFDIHSVADFGCGRGSWLAKWKDLGVETVCGVDGEYLRGQSLLTDESEIRFADLCQPFDFGRQFDLVQSLEVAEHLPATAAKAFIETLTGHSEVVLFSAATPGQGGMHHVNERPLQYWREIFEDFGFVPMDLIRPAIERDPCVEPWYRYNSILYVATGRLETLPKDIRDFEVVRSESIRDYAPLSYRIRKLLVRPLPVKVVNWLAQAKAARRTLQKAEDGEIESDDELHA